MRAAFEVVAQPPRRADDDMRAVGELAAFRDALRRHLKMPVARRYSGGRDVHAACGMLAGGAAG